MAATAGFKQQCPSCEAMVPVRDTGLIGKKIDCPKCKYRFVVEDPGSDDAGEEPVKAARKTKTEGAKRDTKTDDKVTAKKAGNGKPANGKAANGKAADGKAADGKPADGKPADGVTAKAPPPKGKPAGRRAGDDDEDAPKDKKKKGGPPMMLILGGALAVVAVIVLIIGICYAAGLFDIDSDSKGKGGGTGTPVVDKPPDDKDNNGPPPVARPDITNLLPNDTQLVVHVPDLARLRGSGLGLGAFTPEAPGGFSAEAFKQKLGFGVEDVEGVVFADNITQGWHFAVVRTKKPVNKDDLKQRLGLDDAKKKEIETFEYNTVTTDLDALSNFLLRAAPKDSKEAPRPLTIHIYDDQTLVFAHEVPMEKFLKDKRQPEQLTKPAAPPPDKGDDKGGGGGMQGGPPGQMQGGPPGGMGGFPGQMQGGPPGGMGGRPPFPPGQMQGGPPGGMGGFPGQMQGGPPGGMGGKPPQFPPGQMQGGPPGGMGGGAKTMQQSQPQGDTDGGARTFQQFQPPGGMGGFPPGGMMGGFPPGGMMGGFPPGGMGGFPPGGMGGFPPGGNFMGQPPGDGQADGPAPPPSSGSFLTIKPALKQMLDRIEQQHDPKEPLLLALALDASAAKTNLPLGGDDEKGLKMLKEASKNVSTIGNSLFALKDNHLLLVEAREANSDAAVKQLEAVYKLASAGFVLLFKAMFDIDVSIAGQQQQVPPGGFPPGGFPPGVFPPGQMQGGPPGGMGGFPPGFPGQMQGGPPGGMGGFPPGFPPGGMGGFPPGGFPGQPGGGNTNFPSKVKVETHERTIVLTLDVVLNPKAYFAIREAVTGVIAKEKGRVEMAYGGQRIHQLAAALKGYLKDRNQFPRGAANRDASTRNGLPWPPNQRVSWMVELLPYLGQRELYQKIDLNKSWSDAENLLAAVSLVPEFLSVPSADTTWWVPYPGVAKPVAATHWVGVAGVGLDAAEYQAGDATVAKKLGVFGYDRETRLDQITDGLDQTIALIQVPTDYKTPWLAGGGSTVRGVPETDSVRPFVCVKDAKGRRGTYAIMCDGKVRFIPADISDKDFQALCTIAGGDRVENLDTLCPVVAESKSELKTRPLPGVNQPPAGGGDKQPLPGQPPADGNQKPQPPVQPSAVPPGRPAVPPAVPK